MPLEASVERITLNSRGNGENIQLLTEGDMIVPDINPDIYQILKADEDIIIDTVKAGQGRVSFSGRLYTSELTGTVRRVAQEASSAANSRSKMQRFVRRRTRGRIFIAAVLSYDLSAINYNVELSSCQESA